MIVGVTSAQEFGERCPRRWWFKEVAGLREGTVAHGITYGNVLHAVLERWLNEEEPFPAGWQWDSETRRRIDPAEEAALPGMLTTAIEEGWLERHPRRLVEETWWRTLSAPRGWKEPIVLRGTVDLQWPGYVLDHKGVKARRYAKGVGELKQNLQLLVYAHVNLETLAPDAESAEVAHLYWDRGASEVFPRGPVVVSRKAAADAWGRFVGYASRMLPVAGETRWRRVPGAFDGAGAGREACRDYGGCGFLPICSGQQTARSFERRCRRLGLPPEAARDFEEGQR